MADEIVRVVPTPINPIQVKGAIAFSAEHSRVWAEGSDEEVEKLGGEHSAKGWAGEAREEGKQYTDEQIAQARVEITEQINTNSLNVLQQAYGYTDNAIAAEAAIREAQAESYVKKNESPTLDAGGSYAFNFETDSQNLRIMASDSGLEFEHRTAGSAIRMGSNGDISLEPSAGKIVFADGNPVITTKDKATTSSLGVVKVDGETISANNGVISVTPECWQKPADWVDIRSGALPNSVYFLVGHSADYATYPTFAVSATVSNSGTYDVFVDGIKQATTNSGTVTTLNWQTLALTSGWDVTTPSALHTHIVRVTPTTSTDTISQLRGNISGGAEQGVLWVHFSISNSINLANFLAESGNNNRYQNRLCEAVTAEGNEIAVTSSITGAFRQADALVEIPKLNFSGESINGYRAFTNANKLKKIQIKNGTLSGGSQFFYSGGIEKIEAENAFVELGNYSFSNATSIRKLPNLKLGTRGMDCFVRLDNLEPTFLDLSSATGQREIRFSGASENITNLKGITVSNSAPFNGSSPQINLEYTNLDRAALINLFNSMPTVSANQVCNITGTTGASDLTASDIAVVTGKGWTLTR